MPATTPTSPPPSDEETVVAHLPLADLEDTSGFPQRHIGLDAEATAAMLAELGFDAIDDLVDAAVPAAIRGEDEALDLPAARSEPAVLAELRRLAGGNRVLTSYIGMGYAGTITPPVIQRNVLEDPAWYTAYTPYQPEISQGRLEALLTFQTVVCDLTGMELANASLLDEATAAAEAMTLLHRTSRDAGDTFVIDTDCHPQTIAVVATRARPLGIQVVVADPRAEDVPDDAFGVLLQYPGTGGAVHDDRELVATLHERGVLVGVAADLLALLLLVSPGEMGADVVVGSSQRFGVPMMFGGPHAAFMATRRAYTRSLPGRLVGVSVDAAGRSAYRLALQTREQHIRRERATSNICTSQVLLAVMAAMYAVYHGPDGLQRIAERVHRATAVLAAGLRRAGVDVVGETFFDTLTLRAPDRADGDDSSADWVRTTADAAVAAGYNLRRVDDRTLGVTLDETTTIADLHALLDVFGVTDELATLAGKADDGIPDPLRRGDEVLTHEVFHLYRSETEMLRYLRRLSDADVALDRAMIPLGSCTMKLNATTEMAPVTWPEFASLHPYVPAKQAQGYRELIAGLERWLAEVTGYDAVSVQPNAGSQGELAGLLAIRRYHDDRGDADRVVCLIPESAHGTNAASAVMAGMRVLVVKCDDDGNVDVGDLERLASGYADELAALMVTYPSTHGVFEARITEICDVVHAHGGQVYLDGANLNALVGIARPGRFGADVSHLNLHKTFCIPHGGGGPGVGPVAARAHLAPFLPGNPLDRDAAPVSAAPWGSAGILPIAWAYIALMGPGGMRAATQAAILSANYVAARLADHYPVLYTGANGLVAHECIVDVRAIQAETGVSNEDVAKRLIDYGFHAPTMSFPVAGTLMIEPTESESRRELDRFCDAMIAIRSEIARVAAGEWPAGDNPLVNAPHTAEDLLTADWTHPYSREQAAYPVDGLRAYKYWPPVSRIDQAHGDRHLVCTCPPVDAYREA